MEKVKLEFKAPTNKKIEYNDVIIEITPFMGVSHQIFLIDNYINDYFSPLGDGDVSYPYLKAEYNLMGYIYQLLTSIEVSSMDNDSYADSVLFEKIVGEIKNYGDFRKKLDYLVAEKKAELAFEKSAGNVLLGIANKANQLMDSISKISPEEIKTLQENGAKMLEELSKNSILSQTPKRTRKKAS